MAAGQIVMIGLALIGVVVVWLAIFLASLWASERIVNFYNEFRATLGYEADEHASDYENRA